MPKRYIDETGHRYGKLTVISISDKKDSKGVRFWKCLCDCGKITEVRGTELRNGKTKSCGCGHKGCKIINEIGNRYGNLTVIGKSERLSNNHAIWICQCDCGNICEISGSHLRAKDQTCCPICSQKKAITNEIGNQYGDLLVIEYIWQNLSRQALWKCQCQCGNEVICSGHDLRQGKKLNCGCKKIRSYGATEVKRILTEYSINFIEEKTFNTCRFPDTNQMARFDFYLPDKNILIEYDGPQHEKYTNFSIWDTPEHLRYTQEHDAFKNQWCKDNNIKLIRIPYQKNTKNIFNYLKEFLI